ncbi:MAG: DinB family protein [Ktedonobacteraceae bacterium]|nr:DinB family protein [Ktedonobacteraceae bacterium]
MLQLDFAALRSGTMTLNEQTKALTQADLRASIKELFDTIQTSIAGATDQAVIFVPNDPEAQSGDEKGWTLGHVVAHLTATLEECFAIAAQLARGIEIAGDVRLRYETPWESIQTAGQVTARLAESRRMATAFLDAWPDEPNLQVASLRIPTFGPMNAISTCALGLLHGQMHLQQITEILRQAGQSA